ncbi:hypothetical protein [Stappia indica]|uniref:hypothetical protein n=1 Tax=Stappia indica TaxID=538381 RepID=UPI001495A504|nr:hypothetical protein [Stappia indica]
MGEAALKIIAVCVSAIMLAGCQSTAEFQASIDGAKPAPASIKAAIVDAARDQLFDPYSIRDAEISYMQLNKTNGVHWLCVKANSKNRLGGYTGRQSVEVNIRNGKLIGSLENSPACNNSSLKWQRFPQLEALKNL